MKKMVVLLTAVLVSLLFVSLVSPCTTFTIKDGNNLVFGRNLDWSTAAGHIEVNKKGLIKQASVGKAEKPFEWVSLYGSVTFNQLGKEFPFGGMNEKGLVVEQMWLDAAKYPEADDRAGLSELQWIQYQLDTAATVDDVIASDKVVRISSKLSGATLHFLVTDSQGNSAVIEYLDGKMNAYSGKALPFTALTNDCYFRSLQYQKTWVEAGDGLTVPGTEESLVRFSKAAKMITAYNGSKNAVDYSFDILNYVGQDKFTQWSIVYDIKNMKIYYRTYTNQAVKSFDLKNIDFTQKTPSMYADIEADMRNKAVVFQEYSYEANRALIERAYNAISFLKEVPAEARDRRAHYPELMKFK